MLDREFLQAVLVVLGSVKAAIAGLESVTRERLALLPPPGRGPSPPSPQP